MTIGRIGRRGMALPVALVGLVAMSLLVTTALLTSTAESAMSAAQAGSTRLLYSAEGGISEVLRTVALEQAELEPGARIVVLPENQQRVRVTAAVLREARDPAAPDDPRAWTRTYSLTAEPVDARGNPRGRAVVAMVRQRRAPTGPLALDIRSALTLGGDLRLDGGVFTVSGQSDACAADGVAAVRTAGDSEVAGDAANLARLAGHAGGGGTTGTSAMERAPGARRDLAREVLRGRGLDDVVDAVPPAHRYGPRFGGSAWDGSLDAGEGVAVVDADGGTVEIRSGGGVVIVVDGDARMQDGSSFDGVIVVEGNVALSGDATIRGALVSFAMRGGSALADDDSPLSGSVTVQYDRCVIDAALRRFGDTAGAAPARIVGNAFAWFEVVR
jgi:hypothetical protein